MMKGVVEKHKRRIKMENFYYFLCFAVGCGFGWIARLMYVAWKEDRKKKDVN